MPADDTRFTEVHAKFIAEFYVQNYDEIREANPKATHVIFEELAAALNSKYNKKFTAVGVRWKLKNMKQEARRKLHLVNRGLYSLHGDEPDLPQLNETDAMLVSRLIADMATDNDGGGTSAYREDDDDDDDDDDEDDDDDDDENDDEVADGDNDTPTDEHASATAFLLTSSVNNAVGAQIPTTTTPNSSSRRQQHQRPAPAQRHSARRSVRPRALSPTNTPAAGQRRRRTDGSFLPNYSNNYNQEPLPSKRARVQNGNGGGSADKDAKALKKSVLLLQKQVLEHDLRLKGEKAASIHKFNIAVEEFRRHVAEQRLLARGVEVNSVPVDIPPGMEGVGFQ